MTFAACFCAGSVCAAVFDVASFGAKGDGVTLIARNCFIDDHLVKIALIGIFCLLAGCQSAHVGMGVPIPGPVKPSVGVTVNKSGIKGTGRVGAKVVGVSIHAGGTTKPIGPNATNRP